MLMGPVQFISKAVKFQNHPLNGTFVATSYRMSLRSKYHSVHVLFLLYIHFAHFHDGLQ